ncbi:N-acetylglucosamine-6-phosphate deacetylase [Nesterenkonia ebinurensis]|uniref:N-acetylglucosamine-6-phosphate deacetylase n=1 Tax=Nesterenkonia ebinurensis TaxID=2608252 RepID=UPI00123DBBC2|nr:N-acetylglucosamine-6-phosphate deacetylase [Nesterenkonia ebinurensis]
MTPGYIDLHSHGAAGWAYDDASTAQLSQALAVHRAHGTTGTLLSLVSAPVEQLAQRLQELRGLLPDITRSSGVTVHGVHLEGPFLTASRCGAHDPRMLCAPTPEAVDTLLEAGEGVLRQVTLAPERPGAAEAIRRFTEAGVTVAVGHTEADYGTAAAAFDLGAALLTHAFNAMPGLGHRDPGPVGAALARDHVALELIADGVHVHPVMIRAMFSTAPGRIVLVSDSMSATGLGDGEYRLGGLPVEVRNAVPLLAGTQTLAGSTLTMDRAVEVAVSAGVSRTQAVEAASVVPSRLLGLNGRP